MQYIIIKTSLPNPTTDWIYVYRNLQIVISWSMFWFLHSNIENESAIEWQWHVYDSWAVGGPQCWYGNISNKQLYVKSIYTFYESIQIFVRWNSCLKYVNNEVILFWESCTESSVVIFRRSATRHIPLENIK